MPRGNPVRNWSFIRADDITESGDSLKRLSFILEDLDLPCLLAVIPLLVEESLPVTLRKLFPKKKIFVAQHGTDHKNRATGFYKDDLGDRESDESHLARLLKGRLRLQKLFPKEFVNVYVPPWNRVTPQSRKLISLSGFNRISGFHGKGGPIELLNVSLDVQESYRPAKVWEMEKLLHHFFCHRGGGIMLHPELLTQKEAILISDALLVCRRKGLIFPPEDKILDLIFSRVVR